MGPELSFLLAAKIKSSGTTTDVKSDFETFDKGIAVGGGYSLGNIETYIRFVKGFKGISEVIITDPLGNNDREEKVGSNNALQLGICWIFK
jgi:hypothetical protein